MAISNKPFQVILCDRCMKRFERHVVEAGRINDVDEWLETICPAAALDGFCVTAVAEAAPLVPKD